ncbi:hypothetical protein HPB49_016693 [Dermacentor silvarum]|uniref:Uncharacterized protein n=1 Tax=Dermacentor silvarum TaxID=543639 RepID=A0ACB8E1J9_DERSI|nr:hypothetical protein HPB49_016693 [Dermacentor silvarum]
MAAAAFTAMKGEQIRWNCRGFRAWKKQSHLQLYLQSLSDMPALLALQEPGMDAEFSGYSTFQGGPSTCILVNKAYTAVQVDLDLSTEQEYTMVRVLPLRRRDPSIHILNIYSPPHKPRVTFSEIFLRAIKLASKEPLVIVGDFNATSLQWGYYFEKARGPDQMSSRGTSRLFRSLIDPSQTRGETQKQLRRALQGYQGTTAQLADTLCGRYLCRTEDPSGPECTYSGKLNQQLDAPFELHDLKAGLVKMRRAEADNRPWQQQRKRTKIQASSLNTPPQPVTRTRQTVLLRPAERFTVSEIPHGALQDATPPDHAKGICHGFDVKDDGPTLFAQIPCWTHKPVAARPLDSQGRSVLVTFADPTLPRFITYRLHHKQITPFRPKATVCTRCHLLVHDLCPTETPRCSTCGRPPHRVEIDGCHEPPICRNCEGPHIATDKSCPLNKQLMKQRRSLHKVRIAWHRQSPSPTRTNASTAATNHNSEIIVSTFQPGDHSSASIEPPYH